MIGNGCADALAKHQAVTFGSAEIHIPPIDLDGDTFFTYNWLAMEKKTQVQTPTTGYIIVPRLKHLPNLKDTLKSHMHQAHRLGNADITTGYYSYYQSLLSIVS